VADTSLPVLIQDEMFEQPQHLRPTEAELLMGMPPDCTAGNALSARDRLKCIGNGWDMNVVEMLFRFSRLAQGQLVAAALQTSLAEPSVPIPSLEEVADSIPNIPFLCEQDLKVQSVLLAMHSEYSSEEFASMLEQHTPEHRIWYLALLKNHFSPSQCLHTQTTGSVLDSGSSRHLDTRVHITDQDDRQSLMGFNNADDSVVWTEGSGYLPLKLTDENTGQRVSLDVHDVHQLSTLSSPILSLGKLLRDGAEFHLQDRGRNCVMITPGGAHRVRIDLGVDDILRVDHEIRSGSAAAKLPQLAAKVDPPSAVYALRRTASEANSAFLHDVFNHCGSEKIYQTLGVTKGYHQCRLVSAHCDTCAQARARSFGLSRKRHKQSVPESAVLNVATAAVSVRDQPADPGDEADADLVEEFEFVAPVAGRDLGIQAVPRFDLHTLRPFELMFVDNKDYPCPVRGGAVTALIFIDYATRAKYKVDVSSKVNNGAAFQQIVACNGIHKCEYHCRVFTDGCGSMAHVRTAAIRLGLDHAYTPPHQQSLNEAEKVADQMWAAARALLLHSNAPTSLFAKAVEYAMYVDLRTATTESRGWKTPFEMIRGGQPSVLKLHRFYTKAFVTAPRSKRLRLERSGLVTQRAEQGRFVGFHSPLSSTYAVMLSDNRLVHSLDVTFNDADYRVPLANAQGADDESEYGHFPNLSGRSEEAVAEPSSGIISTAPDPPPHRGIPDSFPTMQPYVQISPCPPMLKARSEYFDPNDDAWKTHSAPPKPRPRPVYTASDSPAKVLMARLDHIVCAESTDISCMLQEALHDFRRVSPTDHNTLNDVCHILALHATKDIEWSTVLNSSDAQLAIDALQSEKASLQSTILTPIGYDHPERAVAEATAVTGRYILDVKRSKLRFKARGVKQGFKENKARADGPDFVYYSHVAKLTSVRMSLFRPNRGSRRVAIKDIATAFLQSNSYPPGVVKYICFVDPVTRVREYFRQSGPIYGEASAPVRWEDTLAPWLVDECHFIRGSNEPCAFLHPTRELLTLLYVDDCLEDGEEDDIIWATESLEDAFKCRDTEWLEPFIKLDYLGMEISHDHTFLYISMEAYIMNCVRMFKLSESGTYVTPIDKPIDCDSGLLNSAEQTLFMTATGCLGWLNNTARPDIALAHSRIAQHLAAPSKSALEAVLHCFRYLKGTSRLCLAAPMHKDDINLSNGNATAESNQTSWEFFVDSDFAGNSEKQNKRRNQNGFIAMENGAPVMWGSKASSVCFAHPDLMEAHADSSSGAAEIYAAGNASQEILHLSYVAEEMGLDFPRPAVLQMDNTTAEAFTNDSASRSKLKHIDVRQEWVRCLRDKDIIKPQHVDTKINIADLFTKILSTADFVRLRDLIMRELPATIT